MDLTFASIAQISSAIKEKKLSAVDVARHFSARVERLDKQLNSFISLNEKLESEAIAIDRRLARGEDLGPLAGVPIAVKDLLCTQGIKTTAGSKMLHHFVPPYDATVVARLKKAGALILGKTNLDEFAMGSSNETSFFGPVKNPWNTEYVSGGSSGGSAAAQAARLCVASIGTDTGGSIRQPASFCGVVGIKPTYGRVSRYGIIAYASSLDQAGPMTSSVEDAAILCEIISGHDEKDSTTSSLPVPAFSKQLSCDVKGLKIGIMQEFVKGEASSEVQKTFQEALSLLKKQGAELVDVSVPLTKFSVPMYYLIAASEASSNLARYDGVRYGHRAEFKTLSAIDLEEFYSTNRGEGFGQEVKRRIMIGTYALSSGYFDAYYKKACQVRRLLQNQYIEAFKKCDVILSPVTATPAFKIGEKISDPLAMYLNDIYTTSTNLAGLPGMSVPFGESNTGMPVGLQITGNYFNEQTMFTVASVLEKNAVATNRRPHVI